MISCKVAKRAARPPACWRKMRVSGASSPSDGLKSINVGVVDQTPEDFPQSVALRTVIARAGRWQVGSEASIPRCTQRVRSPPIADMQPTRRLVRLVPDPDLSPLAGPVRSTLRSRYRLAERFGRFGATNRQQLTRGDRFPIRLPAKSVDCLDVPVKLSPGLDQPLRRLRITLTTQ